MYNKGRRRENDNMLPSYKNSQLEVYQKLDGTAFATCTLAAAGLICRSQVAGCRLVRVKYPRKVS